MNYYYYPLVIILLIAFNSCEGDKIDTSILDPCIKVNARINKSKTRATYYDWEADDMIGIYMIKSGSELSASSLLHGNGKYVTNGDGRFIPNNDSEDIKFPNNGAKVDFVAYYPYSEKATKSFKIPIDVSVQDNQSDINLLYSNNEKGLSRIDKNVNLNFSPALSKIRVNINGSNTSLSNTRVVLKGVNVKGDFSLVDGSITYLTKGNVKMKTNRDGDVSDAILIPNNNMKGVVLEVINNNLSHTFNLEKLNLIESLEPGYTYQIKVNFESEDAEISVVINPSSSINPWIEGPSEEITLGKGEEVPGGGDDNNSGGGDGGENYPYSVEQAKKIGQEKDVWVKGYIVGHYTGTTVKSFSNDLSIDTIKETCIAIASSPNEKDGENTFPVFLKTGDMRNELNLNDNRNILGKEVVFRGHIDKYYGTVGMNSSLNFRFGF